MSQNIEQEGTLLLTRYYMHLAMRKYLYDHGKIATTLLEGTAGIVSPVRNIQDEVTWLGKSIQRNKIYKNQGYEKYNLCRGIGFIGDTFVLEYNL